RRGVTDMSVLAQVQQRLAKLSPEGEGFGSDTLQSLQASVEANPGDMAERLRLAKALYYSLRVDEALAELQRVREAAPHLEGVEDLWIEMLTLKGDQAQLVEALREHVRRATAD